MPAIFALIQGALFGFLTTFACCFSYTLIRLDGITSLSASLAGVNWLVVGIATAISAILWLAIKMNALAEAADGAAGEALGFLLEAGWNLLAWLLEGLGGAL